MYVVLFIGQHVSAKCLEHDYEIQNYLTSSEPPWDNYYRISKAVYPAVDLSSLLIKIWVKFVNDSYGSVSSVQNQSDIDRNKTFTTESTYTWSMSCLYVSAGPISMFAMNVFSLGAIWPNRRERQLHIKLPHLCEGVPEEETMKYFLSTVGINFPVSLCLGVYVELFV